MTAIVSHTEMGMVEGSPAEIGRDPRDMTVEEFQALGHEARPLLKAIRANCIGCCGGAEGEVRRCRIVDCDLWPFRMGSNPFRTREMTEEQRAATAERFAKARAEGKVGRQKNPDTVQTVFPVEIDGKTIPVTIKQKEAFGYVKARQLMNWSELHGKTRNYMTSAGWISLDVEDQTPSLTDLGRRIVTALEATTQKAAA